MTARPETDAASRARRRTSGRRRAQQRRRRRRSLLRTLLGFVLLSGLVAGGVLAATYWPRPAPADPVAEPSPPIAPDDTQPTLVFVTYDETDPAAGAALVFVLVYDHDREDALVLLVPEATVADIPGHGLERLSRAFAYGGPVLLGATIDNLLGVDFDGVVAVSAQGWAAAFGRVGGLTVELRDRLVRRHPDGRTEVRFEPGEQYLDGPRLAELLTFEAAGERGLERLPRVQRLLLALFSALGDDPGLLDELFRDGAPMLETALPPERLRDQLELVVGAHGRGALETVVLPVSPIGSGDEAAYRIDRDRVERLVEDRLAASRPAGTDTSGRRLQILNGNGRPGIGQEVAQRVLPHGFRVVLTDNADHFHYEETRIVVYRDDPAQVRLAEQIRDVLGVGRIERSRSFQSVVDITIVVGRDFLDLVDREG